MSDPNLGLALLVALLIHSSLFATFAALFAWLAGADRPGATALVWKITVAGALVTAPLAMLLPADYSLITWHTAALAQADSSPSPASDTRAEAWSTTIASAPVSAAEAFETTAGEPSVSTSNAADPYEASWADSQTLYVCLCMTMVLGLLIGITRLVIGQVYLSRELASCTRATDPELLAMTRRLAISLGIRDPIEVLILPRTASPMAVGFLRYKLVLPQPTWWGALDRAQQMGMVAHELAHLRHRDPLWSVVGHLICHTLWFQPLLWYAVKQMRMTAEFAADDEARRLSGDGLGLARSLATLASWLVTERASDSISIATSGLSSYRSTLGQRVEQLLAPRRSVRPSILPVAAGLLVVLLLALLLTPRLDVTAVAEEKPAAIAPPVSAAPPKTESDKPTKPTKPITEVDLFAEEAKPVSPPKVAEKQADKQPLDQPPIKTAQPVPEGFEGFRGQLSGLVVAKNDDLGSFQLEVLEVKRVWKNNTAKHPETVISRIINIENLTGKWLDVLLTIKVGDAVEIETKHVRGPNAEFLGESFKKVELTDIQARLKEKRSAATGEMAANPNQPRKDRLAETEKISESTDPTLFPEGLRGFRGIMIGRVMATDAEQGKLVLEGIEVKRTWPKNTAKNAASLRGKRLEIEGISGKWLDVLLTFKAGDVIEVEAFHNSGEKLDFVQEWLKKLEAPAK